MKETEGATGNTQLTSTFFCDTRTTESFPRTPTEVSPAPLAALKAYSVKRHGRKR